MCKKIAIAIMASFLLMAFNMNLQVMTFCLNQISYFESISMPQYTESSSTPQNTFEDQRMQSKRPYMEMTSHTFIDSMRDIERKYKPTPECDAFGGTKFMDDLLQSSKSLLHKDTGEGQNPGQSSIVSYRNHAMDIYFAENVSVVVTMPTDYDDEHIQKSLPSFVLEVDGKFVDEDARSIMLNHPLDPNTKLAEMTARTKEKNGLDECTEYFEYPVMLVDNNVDTNNWWFFLKVILHHYISVAVVQPKITGDYNQDALRVMFALNDQDYSKSFVDAFEFFFSDRRDRDSRQIWHVPVFPEHNNYHHNNTNHNTKRYCFRKLLWAPGGSTGADKILINKRHENMNCFSSIVYSYAAHLKAALHIPALPRPDKPRVVWVGRDPNPEANPTNWQKLRIVENQEEVIRYLQNECHKMGVDFIVAAFYADNKTTPFQEQVLRVSRANIMIGMHGAGLNMFHFMPFNSVVVEIHRNTNGQMNSLNFVNYIKEGKYITTNAIMEGPNRRTMKKEPIWETLKEAIDEWSKLA